ncbi:Uncharacterized protein TCAP_04997 [Tolypocladium capitatum]|uniref:Protein kinase domain-containing protein n=1 Tax=Tolypocladium capitatum TaxID=45235 RepID=A0A2K3QC06_9HYPO|nr:Uncharacterized protein TCAP_04997 [Tolypocladium capitatum]
MDNSQRLPDQLDLFFYTGNEILYEDLTKYKRYGLHPIRLGDILPQPSTCVSDLAKKPRYRIMLKLGFGAFATVWLARDLVEKRHATVFLRDYMPNYGGVCLLHEQGIAHGDPHIANFGIALPQLDRFDEDDITEYFANPEIIPVVPRDPSFPLHSVPPYLVQSVLIADFLQAMKSFPASSAMSVRILDFGRPYRTSEKVPLLPGAAPNAIRPPEVVIHELYKGKAGSIWSKAADIWAVGCTLYHIKWGNELITTWGSLDDYLFRAIQFGGPPPKAWLELWNTCDRHDGNVRFI